MQNKIRKIQKRDGQLADFEREKIAIAILEALKAVEGNGEEFAESICDEVVLLLNERFNQELIPMVEDIQDAVEETLIKRALVKPAKAYILYREQHRKIREMMMAENESAGKVDEYLHKLDWQVKENANMAYSLQGLNNYISSHLVKRYWLEKIYPKEIRSAVNRGDFHIHDLQTLGNYCCGWDLYDLLKRGFGGVNGKIQSKPAKHLKTALGHIVNFLYTVQGEIAGAVAFSNFDTLVAPFIRYDNLSYPQVKQAMQEFLFNMNVPTRVGFQTPFSNLTIDITPSPIFEKQPVIIGGEAQEQDYGDFQHEMDMLNRALYEVMLEGDAHGRIFTFPIPTINITKDFPWNKEALEPMWKATAKYGINYFGNYINSDMDPKDIRSMCFPAMTRLIYKNKEKNEICRTTIKSLVDSWNDEKELCILMDGEWIDIKDAFSLENKSGKIVKVSLANGEIIRMTPDHPAMIIKNGELKKVQAEKLRIGDIIPITKKGYDGELGDFDLGRWLGLYIAEGSIASGNTVYFTFHEKEKNLQNFVTKVAHENFALPVRASKDPRWKTAQVWVKGKPAVEWVKRFCGGAYAIEKHLFSTLFGMSKEFRMGALVGIFQGDGYERDAEFHTTNKTLRNDVAELARSLGINYTKRKNPKNTKGDKVFTSYVLRLCKDTLGKLRPHLWDVESSFSSLYKDCGDFYGLEIKNIDIGSHQHIVYDIEVSSKKHLFQLATGVITHNCCRLRIRKDQLYNRGGGGLFGAGSLTGSVGVVTINMPRIGYLSKNEKEFFDCLEKQMRLAKESLEIKRKIVEGFTEKGLYPYCKYWLAGIKKMRGSYWDNHFSTIGLIGMNEALLNFMNKDISSTKGRKFAVKVMDFMRKKLIEYQEETGNLYNLEATPAEGTSYRLALKDKKEYPDIITAGIDSTPYYTNSTQLPVNYTDDLFEALDKQDDLQSKYTGGSVHHLFLGERVDDSGQAKRLVKKVFEKFNLPYVSLTPTFSVCPTHGYLFGEHFECPKCTIKQVCEVYSRVVGYYRPVGQWNEGKQQEFSERKEYKIE